MAHFTRLVLHLIRCYTSSIATRCTCLPTLGETYPIYRQPHTNLPPPPKPPPPIGNSTTCIGAKCPGTSGTVPDLELLSRVPHGTYFLADMSRKFYSTGLTNNYNLPITLVNSL